MPLQPLSRQQANTPSLTWVAFVLRHARWSGPISTEECIEKVAFTAILAIYTTPWPICTKFGTDDPLNTTLKY
jgi:hypothetical protein